MSCLSLAPRIRSAQTAATGQGASHCESTSHTGWSQRQQSHKAEQQALVPPAPRLSAPRPAGSPPLTLLEVLHVARGQGDPARTPHSERGWELPAREPRLPALQTGGAGTEQLQASCAPAAAPLGCPPSSLCMHRKAAPLEGSPLWAHLMRWMGACSASSTPGFWAGLTAAICRGWARSHTRARGRSTAPHVAAAWRPPPGRTLSPRVSTTRVLAN